MKTIKKAQKSIKKISSLIQVLNENETKNYTTILKNLEMPIHKFKKYASWSDEHYTRNCIEENEAFELILLCWENGHKTAVHDHGGEECWVYILEGEFKENIYELNGSENLVIKKESNYKAGDCTYMKDFMGYHDLENLSNKRSMSLHLYAKPIKVCNVYNSKKKTFDRKELSYDSVQEID
ncbi:MAG: cysteine dioxygenase family protein [Flavobacteriaceae bacterium]|nr:cysteine dioxygenase family protein [Flavobacteriaceae bacterium]